MMSILKTQFFPPACTGLMIINDIQNMIMQITQLNIFSARNAALYAPHCAIHKGIALR